MKIQYISDIHLEHRKDYFVNPIAPNLVLCGDIGSPLKDNYNYFIERCSNDFKNVFVIFGNHEYYTKSSNRFTIDEIVNNTKFPKNVYFLNNSCVYLNIFNDSVLLEKSVDLCESNYIKIIGSTLWSNVNPDIYKYIHDYKKIWIEQDRKFNCKDANDLFNISVNYIIKELSNDPNINTILLTHHGAHSVCNGKYTNKVNKVGVDLSSAYTSTIDELYKFKNLLVCISGHTHSSINTYVDFDDHKILFVSNQVGYKCEDKDILNYNPRCIITLLPHEDSHKLTVLQTNF